MGRRLILGLSIVLSLRGAGDTPLDRSTLRGLKTFGIVMDPLDPELENAHISREALVSRMNRYMETAEIHVDPNAREFLALRLMHVRNGRGPYAVCITLGMYQPVALARDPQIRTATSTWEVETVLMSDPKRLPDATIEATNELLEAFVNAWRSVNSDAAAPTTSQK